MVSVKFKVYSPAVDLCDEWHSHRKIFGIFSDTPENIRTGDATKTDEFSTFTT